MDSFRTGKAVGRGCSPSGGAPGNGWRNAAAARLSGLTGGDWLLGLDDAAARLALRPRALRLQVLCSVLRSAQPGSSRRSKGLLLLARRTKRFYSLTTRTPQRRSSDLQDRRARA